MSRYIYDVCVVGAGLIGSAAAQHATSIDKEKRVLLIGPSEPEDRSTTDLFAAHYDEGRLTRSAPPEVVWGRLTLRSVERHRELEEASGINFYDECGSLQIGMNDEESTMKSRVVAQTIGHTIEDLPANEARAKFPYIHFRKGETGLYTPKDSGSINPRKLLQAQLKVARQNGCTVVDDTVSSISHPTKDNDIYEVFTGRGHSFLARSILLATGAFTCSRDLLPTDKSPEISNLKKTVVLVEISEEEYTAKLANMPTMIVYRLNPDNNRDKKYWTYIMKPLRYSDGKLYMKLGGWGDRKAPEAKTQQEASDWYRVRGDPIIADELMTIWRDVFPGLHPVSYVIDGCVTSHTPGDRPYIDMIQPGFGVAVCGCARSAMASDEIGRIAARMILNDKPWDEHLPQEEFKIKLKPTSKL